MPPEWSPQDALLDEFGCYWLGDEIPDVRSVSLMPEAARAAGRVLRQHRERASEVAVLLRELAADRSHPLFGPIAEGTLISWTDDDASWAKFQQVAHRIADRITEALPGSQPPHLGD